MHQLSLAVVTLGGMFMHHYLPSSRRRLLVFLMSLRVAWEPSGRSFVAGGDEDVVAKIESWTM
jgi:hypothetical protein